MAVRDAVRDTQRRIAELDRAYARARTNLERTCARRAEVLAEHDGLVARAEREVEHTIAAMALEIGADLAATILGLGVAHVRQLAKVRLRSAGLKANGDGGPDPRPSHP